MDNRVDWKDRGNFLAGCVDGKVPPVLTLFSAGGQIWISCREFHGKLWSKIVRTFDGGMLLGEEMIRRGNREDVDAVYRQSVEKTDDPEKFKARMDQYMKME